VPEPLAGPETTCRLFDICVKGVTVSEDSEYEQAREEARRASEEALASADQAKAEAERLTAEALTPEMQHEGLRQQGAIYGGLIGIAVVMVQPFLIATSLDTSATICVVAFSVAIPLLAALVMVNRQEVFRGRRTPSVTVTVMQSIAQLAAFVGIVAGFWHITWVAGVGMLVAGLVAVLVHSAGWWRLEVTRKPTP
jgi:hypothetical protein